MYIFGADIVGVSPTIPLIREDDAEDKAANSIADKRHRNVGFALTKDPDS
jgi:hypothetical protein